jgi:hypothetical protein
LNQLGRKVKKCERGIRNLAPIVGVKRKKDEQAEKDITKQNALVLVGFRNAYVFDVSQTDGAELPAMREMSGGVCESFSINAGQPQPLRTRRTDPRIFSCVDKKPRWS